MLLHSSIYATGFTVAYRLWLLIAAVVELCYPTFAAESPTLVAVTQVA